MSDVDTLVEMGFPRNRAEKALTVTKNQGVQVAMDWLFAHAEDADIDEPVKPSVGHTLTSDTGEETTDGQAGAQAMDDQSTNNESEASPEKTDGKPSQCLSLKCDDCGKLLKSEVQVQMHAGRTGHQNFSESTEEVKPLTEEEKKKQLEKLQEKMAEKRQERIEKEKQENIEKEKIRRKTGKEMTEYKQKFEFQEVQKIAEQRRREKIEEKKLRQKLKEQIAKDRAEKNAQSTPSKTSNQTTAAAAVTPSAASAPKEYTSCRLQFRLTDGSAITGNFEPTDTLSAVVSYISSKRTDSSDPFSLSTTFPRKTFSESDMTKTLKECGLVPSAVVVLTRR